MHPFFNLLKTSEKRKAFYFLGGKERRARLEQMG